MERISLFLKSSISTINLFVLAFIYIFLGVFMFLKPSLFMKSISVLLIIYFISTLIIQFFNLIINITKDRSNIFNCVIKLFLSIILVCIIIKNMNNIWKILPIIISTWTIIIGLSNLISFLQYHNEDNIRIKFIFIGIFNLVFGIKVIIDFGNEIPFSMKILGCYLVALGLFSLLDGISSFNDNYNHNLKSRFRIVLPPFLTMLVPLTVLNHINKYFKTEEVVDLSFKKKDIVPNVEVLIHVSANAYGKFGHADLVLNDTVISYGGYDNKSMKYAELIGDGVLFELKNKNDYIDFCQKDSNKTIFGFGLYLKEKELKRLLNKLDEIKSRVYEWKCDQQIDDTKTYGDYASRLYRKTNVKFYKFNKGNFKYYSVVGTNCVKLVDTLLNASGFDNIFAGIITPGTYFDYLNKEFMRKGSRVVSRTVYYNKK
jgi:uncharacterized membrane protein HdeD (DUF308 family)